MAMKSMYALMALTLGGAMAGNGNIFGENSKVTRFEDLSPEDKQRYLEKFARKKEEGEKKIALSNGLTEFSFTFDYRTIYIYALNKKSAAKKCRRELLRLIEGVGKENLEYPNFSRLKGTDVSGIRKAYEKAKLQNK